mgnify:CR=1 FL=1
MHQRRAARHPALTSPHPGLLHAAGGPVRGLNVWYIYGILVTGYRRLAAQGGEKAHQPLGGEVAGHAVELMLGDVGFVDGGARFSPQLC